jgi:hypothetical protein
MRKSDVDELFAITDKSPLACVHDSVRLSVPDFLFAARDNGVLLCLGGCSIYGNPWLLGTDELSGYSKSLTRLARQSIRGMLARGYALSNCVDVRNTQAIAWLKLLGFEFRETFEVRPGYPLIRFEMVKKC